MNKPNIPTPTTEVIKTYLEKWDNTENYALPGRSLELLFRETYPENKIIEHILIKVCCLNQLYSTNIYSPVIIAKHILNLDVDKYFATGDYEVVNKIAEVTMTNGKIRKFYSFASKYCSHHWPERYPIYDNLVDKMLMYFQRRDKFYEFKSGELRNYSKFVVILQQFKEFYKIYGYKIKDIDKYLWQVGKGFFPIKY